MSTIWTLAEIEGGELKGITHELLTAARSLADASGGLKVGVVALGHEIGGLVPLLGSLGADLVALADAPSLANAPADVVARVIAPFLQGQQARTVLLGHTAIGKDVAGRLAVRLDCGVIADATELKIAGGQVMATRSIFGGGMWSRATAAGESAVITVRPRAVTPATGQSGRTAETLTLPVAEGSTTRRVETLELKQETSTTISLSDAEVVVAGGRGMGGADRFGPVETLAKTLGAAVGASRAVVDSGWRPHKEQIGQTGRTVSPKLYVALGISGAIQHLVGMRTSGTIIAINTDAEAPIMKVANVAAVGDVHEIVPALVTELSRQGVGAGA
jgi:electron transfer flavoprotein alpha subunit